MAWDHPKDDDKRLEILEGELADIQAALDKMADNLPPQPVIPATPGTWTVAAFMVADDTLRPFAERDLQEMAKAGTAGLKVMAQIQWEQGWKGERHAVPKGGPQIRKFNRPAGVFQSVKDEFRQFLGAVNTAMSGATASDRLMVVLWGHAFDGHFGGLGTSGMTMTEIAAELASSGLQVHILGFDACETSTLEVMTALAGRADRIIGSQVGVPFSGWPYHLIFEKLSGNTGMSVDGLSKVIMEQYWESYRPSRVTLTSVDGTANHPNLSNRLDALANEIGKAVPAEAALPGVLLRVFDEARHDSAEPSLDLRDFCRHLKDTLATSAVSSQVTTLLTAAANAIAADFSGPPYAGPFVHGHARRGPNVEYLNGLAFSPYRITAAPGWTPALRKEIYEPLGWPLVPFWATTAVDHSGLNVAPARTKKMLNDSARAGLRSTAEQLRGAIDQIRALRGLPATVPH